MLILAFLDLLPFLHRYCRFVVLFDPSLKKDGSYYLFRPVLPERTKSVSVSQQDLGVMTLTLPVLFLVIALTLCAGFEERN